VVMELMATWCPPCLTQQGEEEIASRQLDPERVAFVTVDADTRESAATVRAYADRNGFDWTYAVATPALLRALADEYGIGVLDPPATPIIIVASDGSARLVEVGIKPAERLVELARAAGA
jgi:thiol-disulfide isomerase/thioredoxin